MTFLDEIPSEIAESVVLPLLDLPSQFSLSLVNKYSSKLISLRTSKLSKSYHALGVDEIGHPFVLILSSALEAKHHNLILFFLSTFESTFDSFSLKDCEDVLKACLRWGTVSLFRNLATALKCRYLSLPPRPSPYFSALGESGDFDFISDILAMFGRSLKVKNSYSTRNLESYQKIIEGCAKGGHLSLFRKLFQKETIITTGLLGTFIVFSLFNGYLENAEMALKEFGQFGIHLDRWLMTSRSLEEIRNISDRNIVFNTLDFLSKYFLHSISVVKMVNVHVVDWLVKHPDVAQSLEPPFNLREHMIQSFRSHSFHHLVELSRIGYDISVIANVGKQQFERALIISPDISFQSRFYLVERFDLDPSQCIDVAGYITSYDGSLEYRNGVTHCIQTIPSRVKDLAEWVNSGTSFTFRRCVDEFILDKLVEIGIDVERRVLILTIHLWTYSGFLWVKRNYPHVLDIIRMEYLSLEKTTVGLRVMKILPSKITDSIRNDLGILQPLVVKRKISLLRYILKARPDSIKPLAERVKSDAEFSGSNWSLDVLDGLAFFLNYLGVEPRRSMFAQSDPNHYQTLSPILIEYDPNQVLSSYSVKVTAETVSDPLLRALSRFSPKVPPQKISFSNSPVDSIASNSSQTIGSTPTSSLPLNPQAASSTRKRVKGNDKPSDATSSVNFDDPFNTQS